MIPRPIRQKHTPGARANHERMLPEHRGESPALAAAARQVRHELDTILDVTQPSRCLRFDALCLAHFCFSPHGANTLLCLFGGTANSLYLRKTSSAAEKRRSWFKLGSKCWRCKSEFTIFEIYAYEDAIVEGFDRSAPKTLFALSCLDFDFWVVVRLRGRIRSSIIDGCQQLLVWRHGFLDDCLKLGWWRSWCV